MDRLTKRSIDGSIMIENATKIAEAFDRLAAYEDTGLTPEEIQDVLERFSSFLFYMTNGRMSKTIYTVATMRQEADACTMEMCNECADRQLAEKYGKAKAEGCLIVMPCKVGDTVWFIDREFNLQTRKWASCVSEGYVKAIKFSARPTKITVEYPDPESTRDAFKGADYNVRSIGKTLFLTREEAEAALKER